MAISKIILNGVTQIDLTQDSVSANNLIAPNTAHGADGNPITGTATAGVDIPIFTVVWDSNFENISSISCNKTYNDCVDLTSDGAASALVAMADPNGEVAGYAHASIGAYGTNYLLYTVFYGFSLGFDIQYNSNGTIQAIQPSTRNQTLNITQNGTYYPEGGMLIEEVNVIVPATTPSLQSKTATPSETAQTITADNGYDGLSQVSVGAISNTYVGTGVTRQAAKTVTPTESSQTAVASGVYTTGAVTVGAISSTYVGSGIDRNDSSDLTASGATVTAPAGYYEEAATKSVASGSATTPATTVTANPSISVSASGLITATASATKSVTPTVSAGYISSGTSGTITVSGSNTQQLTTQGTTTYNTSTTDQTIASGRYLTGTQTIKAVTVSGLSAANIADGVTVMVGDSNDPDRIASVTGTLAFQTIYSGSSAPSASQGVNGDIYIKVVN